MKSIEQIKKEKAKEKELLEKIKKEEEELEKEVNEKMQEPKFSFKESLELLKSKDEEELEYESYLTEEELAEEENRKKEDKRIIKTAAIVMVSVILATIVGVRVFYDTFKSDLLKITEPLLKSHYEEITGEKTKTKTIEEFMTKDENKKDVGTGICLLTTEDDKHIMAVNNELIGDDIRIESKKEEVKKYLLSHLGNIELVIDSIALSYDDYYLTYNRFVDYINVLPSKLTTEELISSNKLALTYKAIYKGDLDLVSIENIINDFSNNSTILLFKQDMTGISNVTLIKRGMAHSFNITAEIEKNDGITYLELDRNVNDIIDVNASLHSSSSVSTENDYNIVNPISIKTEKNRQNRDEEEKPAYYLIRLASSLITEDGFVELSTYKREDTYREIEKDDYEDVFLFTIGSYTYVFGENDLFIGQIRGKKTFLCKLGIC